MVWLLAADRVEILPGTTTKLDLQIPTKTSSASFRKALAINVVPRAFLKLRLKNLLLEKRLAWQHSIEQLTSQRRQLDRPADGLEQFRLSTSCFNVSCKSEAFPKLNTRQKRKHRILSTPIKLISLKQPLAL